eukprot:880747-Pyramimonas_sp.AAC.1
MSRHPTSGWASRAMAAGLLPPWLPSEGLYDMPCCRSYVSAVQGGLELSAAQAARRARDSHYRFVAHSRPGMRFLE